jgi:hypothetical protein
MLSSEMLNLFNSENAPPHILKLCVGDICYAHIGQKTKVATNECVRILELRQFSVKVQTIEANKQFSRRSPFRTQNSISIYPAIWWAII